MPMEAQRTIREELEQLEHQQLREYASFSDKTRGRDRLEEKCIFRTEYQRDRDRILHCKAFRRLKHKTQVFLAPEGDHYRTRLTHTLEVAQIARTIAKALYLNEDLTEAIALGHDLGHTPFGHAGERALNQICPMGFAHHLQSVRVVDLLERDGQGLNLTMEVRDGIRNHQLAGNPSTLEGCIVRFSDKIAYTNHDIEDAVSAGIIRERDIPNAYSKVLGLTKGERLDTLVYDIVCQSRGKNHIQISQGVSEALYGLRDYLFKKVYTNKRAKSQERKAEELVQHLYLYCLKHIGVLPVEYQSLIEDKKEPRERVVCDYVAGMTDNYAIKKYSEWFIPNVWK